MDFDKEDALAAIIIATLAENIEGEKSRERKESVKPWIQRRNSHGFHSQFHFHYLILPFFTPPNLNFFSASIYSEIYYTFSSENLRHGYLQFLFG